MRLPVLHQFWKTAIRADNQVLALCRAGASCPEAARRFLAIIDEGHGRDGRARIGVINRAINLAITPMSDLLQWSVPDRWSASREIPIFLLDEHGVRAMLSDKLRVLAAPGTSFPAQPGPGTVPRR
jgi:hypothetical protein